MTTIMQRSRAADEGAKDSVCIRYFTEVPERHYESKAAALEASINLAYLGTFLDWPNSVEGHWDNLRHAVRRGIAPDALNRAEQALAPYDQHGAAYRAIRDLRIALPESR